MEASDLSLYSRTWPTTKAMFKKVSAFVISGMMMAASLQAQDLTIGPAETEISYSADKKIFPCKWRKKKTKAIASPIIEQEKQRTNEILENAISKYPASLISKNLKTIHILRTLSFFNLEYGGTYYKRKLYVTNNGTENGYTENYIEGTFHHEFSSILLKRHKKYFDKEAWKEANPPEMKYGDGGLAALKTINISLELDSTLFMNGFLNQYSLASIEEDFNCFAEFLFISSPGFWDAWEKSDAIQRKTKIIIQFYKSIDPNFSLKYFREL